MCPRQTTRNTMSKKPTSKPPTPPANIKTERGSHDATCSASNRRLAALIAHEISARFYLCTDKGLGGVGGYSANYFDDEEAVEKLVEMILPLLPNRVLNELSSD
jgi:hypothetical protein